MCITTNSLEKIPPEFDENYDIVILDEAGWVAKHLVSSTMVSYVFPVIARLKQILLNSETIILSQAKLTENDVKFYTDLKGIDLYDDCIHSIELRRISPEPHIMHWSRDIWTVYHLLWNNLREHGKEQTRVIYVTSKKFGESMYNDIVKRCGDNQCGGLEKDDVVLVTGDSKFDEWKIEFFENVSSAVFKKRVIIVTSVISTGHNIVEGVDKVFVFLHVGILTSDEEKQLIARTRPSFQLDPVYICFITNVVVLKKMMWFW